MAAVNLFILDELSRGDAHGHQLRVRADYENVTVWTDIAVSGLYAALKRLAADGLIRPVRTESAGNYPERTVYAITAKGRHVRDELLRDNLRKVIFRMDPFDLALQRAVDLEPADISASLRARREEFAERARALREHVALVDGQLNNMERRIVDHLIGRLDYEADWHNHILTELDELLRDQRLTRKPSHDDN